MKRIIPLVLIGVLILTMTACGQNPLEQYKKAVAKTDSISKGQLSGEVILEMDFDTEGLTDEEIKQINYFKSVESRMHVKYDEEENKSIVMVYSNFGGMGFDSEVYLNGEKIFMKMPIEGKFIDLSSMIDKFDKTQNEEQLNQFISKESIEAIKELWTGVLNEEDVVAGKSSLLNTENGEVKVTLFTISLSDQQVKALINKVIDILSEDEDFEKMITQFFNDSDEPISVDELLKEQRNIVEKIEVNDFKYEVYIDIDDYIVESNLEATINYLHSDFGNLRSQKISFKSQNWDIEKEQEFNFPELTDENTLELENMDQGMPFMFQDLFNFNEMEGK